MEYLCIFAQVSESLNDRYIKDHLNYDTITYNQMSCDEKVSRTSECELFWLLTKVKCNIYFQIYDIFKNLKL